MPREITHWLISRAATAKLHGRAPALHRAAAAHPSAVVLGAIFHDVLFFPHRLPFGRDYQPFAHRMHGLDGEDPYEIIRCAAQTAVLAGDPFRAFLVGMVSHTAADSTFHPFIFYAVGDYYHPDAKVRAEVVQNHHRLEGLIDMYFAGGLRQTKPFSLAACLAEEGEALAASLTALFRRCRPPAEYEPDALATAFWRGYRVFAAIHQLCLQPRLSKWLHRLCPHTPGQVRPGFALAYSPQLATMLPRISGPLSYRHPVTGVRLDTDLAALFDRAVFRCVALCEEIDDFLVSGRFSRIAQPGPSLEVDLPGVARRAMRFYAPVPLF